MTAPLTRWAAAGGPFEMSPESIAAERSLDLSQVRTALAKTTEVLAAELGNPGLCAPDWSDMEWQVAKAVASIHGVSGLLCGVLRWVGPAHWHAFLADQKLQVAARLPRIQALLGLLDTRAAEHDVAVVALKGAALIALGLYSAGERPMADLDILVREQDIQPAAAVLRLLGYREAGTTWKHRAFEPAVSSGAVARLGESGAADIKLELHTAIREALPVRTVDISRAIFPARPRPGLNDYPSVAALLLHVLHHAAGALVLRELRLLHLHDISRLASIMSPPDWEQMSRLVAATDEPTLWWAYPPLVLAARYFHCVPPQVIDQAARACPARLRRWYRHRTLTDVSISHLWVSAFPGIEWARTGREIAAYVARRVVPSAETLAQRQAFAISQPQVSGGEWSQTSQARRILRWLLARQPRQVTLERVRASLNLQR